MRFLKAMEEAYHYLSYVTGKFLETLTRKECSGKEKVVTEILNYIKNTRHKYEKRVIEITLKSYFGKSNTAENHIVLSFFPGVVSWIMSNENKEKASEQLVDYFLSSNINDLGTLGPSSIVEKYYTFSVDKVEVKTLSTYYSKPYSLLSNFSSSRLYHSINTKPPYLREQYRAKASIIRVSAFLLRASRNGVVGVCENCTLSENFDIEGAVSNTTLEGNISRPVTAMPFMVSKKEYRDSGELRVLFLVSPDEFAIHRWRTNQEELSDKLINDTYTNIKILSKLNQNRSIKDSDIFKRMSKINFSHLTTALIRSYLSF